MLKPGLTVGSLALSLLLGGCGVFEGVSSTVKSLAGAADKDQGSYSQPLAVPPDYELRPPPARAEKKAEPEPEPEDQEKKPEELDTTPVTAAKTGDPERDETGRTETQKAPDKTDQDKAGQDKAGQDKTNRTAPVTAARKAAPEAREKQPQRLVIETPETPKAEEKPGRRQVEVRRQVPPPPPQPSETTGNVQPETRGRETTRPGDPSSGEDELLRRSGAREPVANE